MFYSAVSIYAVQHSDLIICMCVYIYTHTHSFSHTIFHHVLPQEIGYSSLCCRVGPHCLSILNVIVWLYQGEPWMPFVFSQKLHAVIIIYTMMSITWNFTCCIITKISAIPTVYTLSCVNKYLRRYLGLDFFLIKKINNSMYLFIHSFFIWPHLQHMEVPGLRVKSELQLPAYATATATPDPSHICDLYCSL